MTTDATAGLPFAGFDFDYAAYWLGIARERSDAVALQIARDDFGKFRETLNLGRAIRNTPALAGKSAEEIVRLATIGQRVMDLFKPTSDGGSTETTESE